MKARVPEQCLVNINIKNTKNVQEKHCFVSDTALFSFITDIKYRGSATPLYDKLPLEILE